MNTQPLDLLRRLYVAGVRVDLAENDTIRLSGHPAPGALVAELKAHKADVLAVLRAHGVGTSADGYPSPLPRQYAIPTGCLAERTCAHLGPCSRFLMRRSCDPSRESSTGGEAA